MSDYCGQKIKNAFSKNYTIFYKRNHSIILPGDEIKWVYCLRKGLVRNYMISPDGEESTLIILSPYSIFPSSKIFSGSQNDFLYYQALTDIEVIRAPQSAFKKLILSDEKLLEGVFDQISERINTIVSRWQQRSFGNTYVKITSTLIYLADKFGQRLDDSSYIINHWFTHQDLALIAGVSRERTSLVLKELQEKGIIVYEKRFIKINNLNELKDFII